MVPTETPLRHTAKIYKQIPRTKRVYPQDFQYVCASW